MYEVVSRVVSLFLGVVATILLLAALNACASVARAAEPVPAGVGALTWDNEPVCTAALVGPRTAVTAAHCVLDRPPAELELFVGPDVTAPREVAAVLAVLPHPAYDAQRYENDLARVVVDPPLSTPAVPVTSPSPGPLQLVDHRHSAATVRIGSVRTWNIEEDSFSYAADHPRADTCQGDTGGLLLSATGGLAGIRAWECGAIGTATRIDGHETLFEEPCAGVTWEGRCVENRAVWCEDGQLELWDCSADRLRCTDALGLASCDLGKPHSPR